MTDDEWNDANLEGLDDFPLASGGLDGNPDCEDHLAGTTSLPSRPRLVPPGDHELEEVRDRSRSPRPADDAEKDHTLDTSLFTDAGFIDGDRFDCMAVGAATKSAGHTTMKQPWEVGMLSPLFEDKPKNSVDKIFGGYLVLPKVGLWDSLEVANGAHVDVPHPANNSITVARRVKLAPLLKADDDARLSCLARFRRLVLMDLGATRLGRSLTTFAGSLDLSQDLGQIFSDVFAAKATNTLLKRSGSLWRYGVWLSSNSIFSPFSQGETTLYNYVCYLRQTRAGATAASSFIEALHFADALLGFTQVDIKAEISSRVTGAAHSQFMNKRKRKPAAVLTVEEIECLEDAAFHHDKEHCRFIAATLLYSFYSVARWADCMTVENLVLSEHNGLTLLEGDCVKHKTSLTKDAKTRILPYTCVGTGLRKDSWGKTFMQLRADQGFSEAMHFLHSWSDAHGTWASRSMATSEATEWLRELVFPVTGAERAKKLTAHGLKATIITWCQQSRLFSREELTALGHHVEASTKSTLLYSREHQLTLVAKTHRMIQMIRSGAIKPDDPRVVRLFDLASSMVEEEESSQSGSSSPSSESSDDERASTLMDQSSIAAKWEREDATELDHESCWVNRHSGIIYRISTDDETRLLCGRVISCNFRSAAASDLRDANAVVCATCSHVFAAR